MPKACPKGRRFRYVSWHETRQRWVIQRRSCPTWLGAYATELEAAKVAAKTFGIPLDDLRHGPRPVPARRREQLQPEPRCYKNVYWHFRSAVWVVRGPKVGEPSPGSHASQHVAAKLAAAAWKVPWQALKLAKVVPKGRCRKYKNIAWHSRSKTWVAQSRKQFLGSSTDQEAAADMAAKALRLPKDSMRLGRPQVAQQDSLGNHERRFQQLWSVYGAPDPKNPQVPGDLADIIQRAGTGRCKILKEPGLIVPFLLAKYPPHREVMESAYAEVLSQGPQDDRAQLAYNVLAKTFHGLHRTPLRSAWIANVGRNTTHHSGITPFANTSLGMLKPLPPGARTSRSVLCLGQGGRRFSVQPMTSTMRQRLFTLESFGQALLASGTPKTLHEWATEVAKLELAARGPPKVCGLRQSHGAYRSRWIARTWLIWRMRHAGIRCLRISADCTVSDFAKPFPDQCKWILKLAGGRRSLPVRALFQQLHYTGPPEYFSMYTCLWGSDGLRKELQKLGPAWLAEHRPKLIKEPLSRERVCHCCILSCVFCSTAVHAVQFLVIAPPPPLVAQACRDYEEQEGQTPHPLELLTLATQWQDQRPNKSRPSPKDSGSSRPLAKRRRPPATSSERNA
jgi:hypothetical protein